MLPRPPTAAAARQLPQRRTLRCVASSRSERRLAVRARAERPRRGGPWQHPGAYGDRASGSCRPRPGRHGHRQQRHRDRFADQRDGLGGGFLALLRAFVAAALLASACLLLSLGHVSRTLYLSIFVQASGTSLTRGAIVFSERAFNEKPKRF